MDFKPHPLKVTVATAIISIYHLCWFTTHLSIKLHSVPHSKEHTEEYSQISSLFHVNVVETSCRSRQGYPQVGFAILPEYSLHKKAHRGASNTGLFLSDSILVQSFYGFTQN